MPKSLDPKLEIEVHRDLLRKDAQVSLEQAIDRENPDVVAALIDHAAASLKRHDELGKLPPR